MTGTGAPGPVRLFPVDPAPGGRVDVIGADGAVVAHASGLAAAVIAAAATARARHQPVWLVAPDRWSAHLQPTAYGLAVDGDRAAPLDAISRVLAHLPTLETTP